MTKPDHPTGVSSRINRRQWIARVVGGAVAARLSLRASGAANVFSFEQVEQQLRQWEREHPKWLRIEVAGKSVQGRPVFAAIVTDSETDDESKEHVLLAALHSGVEKGATTSALYLMNWLLSANAGAREILRRQVIVVMPMVNPDGYVKPAFVNDHGLDAYLHWTANGPEQSAKMPEAMAVQAMMDRYQPEVFCDVHGNDCSFPGYIHFEGHVNNPWLRSYEPEIERLMDEAALKGGFPTHRGEPDEQRLPAGDVSGLSAEKLSRKRPRAFAGTYCYNRYHSILVATENAWERSFFLRHRRLLEIGNEVWPGEFYAGYPTRTIMTWSHLVTAYGQTAAQRRRSRVELWNKQGQITLGFSNPQRAGFILFVCATTPSAAEKWLGDGTLRSFRAAIEKHPRMNVPEILRQLQDHPDGPGQWGPEARLMMPGKGGKSGEPSRIEHGLALRLRIPFAKSTVTDLKLNGHPVPASEVDGSMSWLARGYRHVQINIPPERSQRDDLFVVTCRYDPGEKREAGVIR